MDSFYEEQCITLKVVIPKKKQAAATEALQAASLGSIEDWATGLEGMLMERKAYVKSAGTQYKEYNTKNGAFIFQMKFVGTEGQLTNIFHTPGLLDALNLINPYATNHSMWMKGGPLVYYIHYGTGDCMELHLPPVEGATPRPTPPVPAAPARATSIASTSVEPAPFTEPMPRMPPVVEEVAMSGSDNIGAFADALQEMSGLTVRTVSSAPISVAHKKRFLVDTEDSVLTFNLLVPYDAPRLTNAEQFEEWLGSEWVKFYDAVPLDISKKFYDVTFVADHNMYLSASFRTHVDTFADIFTDEVLLYLEEIARVLRIEHTFYVQAPYLEGTDGTVKYDPILTHYVRLGQKKLSWCFGGECGGFSWASPPRSLLPPVQVAEVIPVSQPVRELAQAQAQDKVQKRMDELGQMIYELEEEVRQMKKEMKNMEEQIAEKETRIRMFEFAQDELAEFVDEE